jgi:UDP:flavonoid glycosyltransferase YjiC (YdhE family)
MLLVLACFQGLSKRIQEVLQDSSMHARAAAVAEEVAGYAGVAQAADVALAAVSPWNKLKAAAV